MRVYPGCEGLKRALIRAEFLIKTNICLEDQNMKFNVGINLPARMQYDMPFLPTDDVCMR